MLKGPNIWSATSPERYAEDTEPEFDRNRVVWDVDYRRHVMERLRAWREQNVPHGRDGTHLGAA